MSIPSSATDKWDSFHCSYIRCHKPRAEDISLTTWNDDEGEALNLESALDLHLGLGLGLVALTLALSLMLSVGETCLGPGISLDHLVHLDRRGNPAQLQR